MKLGRGYAAVLRRLSFGEYELLLKIKDGGEVRRFEVWFKDTSVVSFILTDDDYLEVVEYFTEPLNPKTVFQWLVRQVAERTDE